MTKTKPVSDWLSGYESRDIKCTYIGGAVAALLVVGGLADKLFGAAPPILRALYILFALLAGTAIGVCKIVYEQAEKDLTAKGWEDGREIARSAPELKYPISGPPLFFIGVGLLLCAALTLLTATFWGMYSSEPNKCTLGWSDKDKKVVCERTD